MIRKAGANILSTIVLELILIFPVDHFSFFPYFQPSLVPIKKEENQDDFDIFFILGSPLSSGCHKM